MLMNMYLWLTLLSQLYQQGAWIELYIALVALVISKLQYIPRHSGLCSGPFTLTYYNLQNFCNFLIVLTFFNSIESVALLHKTYKFLANEKVFYESSLYLGRHTNLPSLSSISIYKIHNPTWLRTTFTSVHSVHLFSIFHAKSTSLTNWLKGKILLIV